MNDTEKFLFDLQGFLKVPDFLSSNEVDAFNAAFDANEDKRGEDGNHNTGGSNALEGRRRGMFTGMLEWVSELTEAQQAVLEPPYIYNRPLVEADGETVIRPRTG